VVVISVILALGVMKIYDEPVRDWLKRIWLKGEQRLPLWLKVSACTLALSALAVWLVFGL
jgi:hypothetical protein